ncbi:triosephosphate isomerase [Kerstersia gyiorum]|uniref:Triosephosphate isomerase n=1 Tax=Kerstersia gyiorum TaxID=206506 RepID=A0A4Q7MP85_9BURK|nr:triose-phosphate isomerase [Kerstersia gyiorum]KAB0543281.1 triose-phosphate isomerase [Kerstersia gyiorum]RZS70404.1 triosephosphate isomerase [Kerstersia gyiorum]
MNAENTRKRLVLGNWKLHGNLADNATLLAAVRAGAVGQTAEIGVCVPFPYLAQAGAALAGSPVSWGAQDVSTHEKGAYTGEVSAPMLADLGCSWALVGHSERRSYHAESNDYVAAKAAAALKAGITPVVCVGETLEQHEAGKTLDVIAEQLAPVLALGAEQVARTVIAYEPVWAIGTGLSATPEQAQEVHAAIRAQLRTLGAAVAEVRILYGGSVKPASAAGLFAQPDIDGGLIGGAALVADDFLKIAAA